MPAPGALVVWESSANPALLTRRIAWSELTKFSWALTALRELTEASSSVARIFAAAAAARGALSSTPLPPQHDATGVRTVLAEADQYLATYPDHVGVGAVRQLRQAAADLADGPTPLSEWVGEEVSRYGHDDRLDRPEALIIVPRRALVAPVRAWLAGQELHADVLTPADARTCTPYRAMLLAGHPGYTYAGQWREPEVALRCFGWLLTAPPAATVHIALPGDTPALDENAAWLLPGNEHPRSRSADPGPPPSARTWRALAPAVRVARHPISADSDTILGTPVSLAGQASVYYHLQFGPRPHTVLLDDDTDALQITATSVLAVQPGTLVLLRAGLAEHTELVERADQWLAEHKGWAPAKISEARQLIAAIKTALVAARRVRGSDTVQRTLAAHGVNDDYARVLATSPLDEYYICPRRRAGYLALLRTLGLEQYEGQFDALATVRTAHQQAGEQIRRDLLTRLSADRAWVEQVDEQGWAGVTGDGHGWLLLATATAVADTALPVPRTLLGVPLNQAGHRIRRVPETGGAR
jgi:hypothetical protein